MSVTNTLKGVAVKAAMGILRRFSDLEPIEGPVTFNRDGMATRHNCDFLRDPRFLNAYRRCVNAGPNDTNSRDTSWRLYVACWVAMHGRSVEGDFVACGVNRTGQALAFDRALDRGVIGRGHSLM